MLARWVAFEASRGAEPRTLSSWLDRQLVSLAQRCAKFSPGEAGSVALPAEFAAMPELVFHLRRSAFLNVFGNAPDETVFYRSLLFRCARHACLPSRALWLCELSSGRFFVSLGVTRVLLHRPGAMSVPCNGPSPCDL